MARCGSVRELFKGRHFGHEVIVLCVRWYRAFKLSSRDMVQMMSKRGITLAHTTILRWVQRYVPEFEKWNGGRPLGEEPPLLISRPDGYIGFRGSPTVSGQCRAYARQDAL